MGSRRRLTVCAVGLRRVRAADLPRILHRLGTVLGVGIAGLAPEPLGAKPTNPEPGRGDGDGAMIVRTERLSRRSGGVTAVEDVSFAVEKTPPNISLSI